VLGFGLSVKMRVKCCPKSKKNACTQGHKEETKQIERIATMREEVGLVFPIEYN